MGTTKTETAKEKPTTSTSDMPTILLCYAMAQGRSPSHKRGAKELLSTMGLTLSEEKTKVTHITDGFDFLGYRVIRSIGTKGKMIPKVLIPERAIKHFQDNIRRILSPSTTNDSAKAKIIAVNRVIRGWCILPLYQQPLSDLQEGRK